MILKKKRTGTAKRPVPRPAAANVQRVSGPEAVGPRRAIDKPPAQEEEMLELRFVPDDDALEQPGRDHFVGDDDDEDTPDLPEGHEFDTEDDGESRDAYEVGVRRVADDPETVAWSAVLEDDRKARRGMALMMAMARMLRGLERDSVERFVLGRRTQWDFLAAADRLHFEDCFVFRGTTVTIDRGRLDAAFAVTRAGEVRDLDFAAEAAPSGRKTSG